VARFADCRSSQDEVRQMADAGRLFASEKEANLAGCLSECNRQSDSAACQSS
jgi:hypothetical protein